jgi:hypothetical protein
LESDGLTYTPDLLTCDGLNAIVVQSRTCSFSVPVLTAEPYMLTWADSVWVILSATNAYGTSIYSDAGNGAILYTIPDAPTEVIEDLTYRTASTLGFNWQTSFYGGTPIIDYTIMSD